MSNFLSQCATQRTFTMCSDLLAQCENVCLIFHIWVRPTVNFNNGVYIINGIKNWLRVGLALDKGLC